MERKTRISALVDKYFTGQSTQGELEELLRYFDIDDERELLTDRIRQEMEKGRIPLQDPQLLADISNRVQHRLFAFTRPKNLLRRLMPFAAAATVLIALGFGIYFYVADYSNLKSTIVDRTSNDIDPGGNKAILTLADGRKIVLDDAASGELAEESGIKITKTEDGQLVYEILRHAPQARASEGDARIADARQPKAGSAGWEYPTAGWRASAMRAPATYNTIETPKGGQYKIILPDSSVVWLNAASSLRYPTRFIGEERCVELTGEAFFQVKRKKVVETQNIASFIVSTATQEVTVLGTEFNINAYTDEAAVKTTLLEGSVRVASTSDQSTNQQINQSTNKSTTLRPNQQSILSGNSLDVVAVDVEVAVAWKNNVFIYQRASLRQIMRDISRWYDVEVDMASLPDETFTATIPRSVKLSRVLTMLEESSSVKFKIEGRRVVLE